MRTEMKMTSKLIAMLLSAILVFAFIPQTGAQAHAGTDPGKASANTEETVTEQDLEDLQKKVDEANAAVTAREADVKNAEAALESAKAARETPGRAFINEKAGASLSVEILTNLYKKNSALKQYATTDTYSKTLASALTPENLKKAADFVDECNELRAKHGLSPLKINYRLMCLSATSAAVSSQVDEHAVIEQFYDDAFPSLKNVLFYPGENLAWGHSDPFDGWYTEEKAKFNQYVASGKYPGLKNMSLNEVSQEYPELSSDIGHYLNIIDGSYTVTGFARSTVPVGKYNNTDEQSFSEESYGESVTTDKFRSELAAYVAGAEGAVSKAETALADANAALSQAKKDRDKAVTEREEAVKRYEEQQGVCVHEWDKGTITKKPTTTTEGEMTYTCEKCKTTRPEPIAKLSKKTNTLTVSGKTITARYKTLKTRSLTFSRAKAIAVNNARGTVTYTKVSVSTKAANKKYGKKIKINTKTGKVTLVKGLKTGTYKVTVKVKAAGNDTYKAMTKTVKFTVKVK